MSFSSPNIHVEITGSIGHPTCDPVHGLFSAMAGITCFPYANAQTKVPDQSLIVEQMQPWLAYARARGEGRPNTKQVCVLRIDVGRTWCCVGYRESNTTPTQPGTLT